MRYTVIIEQGETSWGVHVPDLPGCAVAGETRGEALGLIREAIELHYRDLGKKVCLPLNQEARAR